MTKKQDCSGGGVSVPPDEKIAISPDGAVAVDWSGRVHRMTVLDPCLMIPKWEWDGERVEISPGMRQIAREWYATVCEWRKARDELKSLWYENQEAGGSWLCPLERFVRPMREARERKMKLQGEWHGLWLFLCDEADRMGWFAEP